ncbi:GNAT family N-acetyltransferase [Patescibacteria group bacterium]|jgi:ribosomal protein S18 acetylase RimI-like enzyme|nr:GNAT family N-acetyltransferase [Patescibacteria group bacterium]
MIKILKAKVEDSEELRKLETKIWGEEVTNKYDLPEMIRFGYAYIAKDGKRIIGGIYADKTKDNRIYVYDWVVDEKYRREEIGEKLYKRLTSATKLPVITFLDPNNVPTIEAHKKMGFKILRRVKNAYGKIKGLEGGYRLLVELNKK